MNKFLGRETRMRVACGRIFVTLCAVFAALITLAPAPAQAQATRTWVSGVGDDVNPCSRTAPCKTFAGAISKTAAGGEISVLDPGGFGAVTITKSISIINDTSGEAGILSGGGNGVIVNAPAGSIIILRGLIIDGAPPTTPGLNGIRFLSGSALHVENCLIKNYVSTAAGNGFGILFAPSIAAELYVSHTTLINNGATGASSGGAIEVAPTAAAATATVTLHDVLMQNNRTGLRLNTTTSGIIVGAVNHSTVVGNTLAGLTAATAGGPTATLIVKGSVIAHNATGLTTNGSTAAIRIGDSIVTGNANAVSILGGSSVTSYRNNQIDGNTNNNTPLTQQQFN